MKTMKKYLALLLAVVMALTLFACGDTNDTPVVDGEEQGDVLVLRYGNAAVASAASSEKCAAVLQECGRDLRRQDQS